jgi:hypothetical protein
MLTRRDFQELALVLQEARHCVLCRSCPVDEEGLLDLVEDRLSDFCAARNPLFSRDRFHAASLPQTRSPQYANTI